MSSEAALLGALWFFLVGLLGLALYSWHDHGVMLGQLHRLEQACTKTKKEVLIDYRHDQH